MIFNPDDFGITTADLSTSEMYRVEFKVRGKAAEYFSDRYGVGLNQTLNVYICDGPQRMLLEDCDNDIKVELTRRDMKDVYSSVFLHETPDKTRRFVENQLSRKNFELTDSGRDKYRLILYCYSNNYLRMHGLSPLRGDLTLRKVKGIIAKKYGIFQEKKPLYRFDIERKPNELFHI